MTTLAVIGASYLQRPLVEKAKAMGLRTICFAWEEGAVCRELVNVFYPISIVEKERILAVCQQEHIDGICTIASDVAAPTVAYVAEQMGLVGNSYEASLRANNKWLMRQAFTKANVPCPRHMCVTTMDMDIIQTQMLLPLIVKPSDRSGSLAVNKITDWEQFSAALQEAQTASFKGEAMVEEFIEGREISVEIISYYGKHYPLQITDKVTTGAPHFVELEHHQPSSLSSEMYDIIYAITERALNALGITNGASHAEYKITDDGRICVMEIGARMGGDFIGSNLVQLSTGYDFVKGVIEVALGQFEMPVLTDKAYSGVYFLSTATAQVAHYIQQALQYPAIVQAEQTDTELHNITCSADRSGYFIYRANEKFVLEQ
jgi:biotin carboxylase